MSPNKKARASFNINNLRSTLEKRTRKYFKAFLESQKVVLHDKEPDNLTVKSHDGNEMTRIAILKEGLYKMFIGLDYSKIDKIELILEVKSILLNSMKLSLRELGITDLRRRSMLEVACFNDIHTIETYLLNIMNGKITKLLGANIHRILVENFSGDVTEVLDNDKTGK